MTGHHLSATVMDRECVWDQVGSEQSPSWYLDPLVAAQKCDANAGMLGPPSRCVPLALKTDSFEEAFGADTTLPNLKPYAARWIFMDTASLTVSRARARFRDPALSFLVADVRVLPLASGCLDLVFSNSTLDHFRSRSEFDASIQELARVTRPGGRLILSLDNVLNPTHWALRAWCKLPFAPFPLGYSPTPWRLRKLLRDAGFEVQRTGTLIHNPRLVSTALFLLLRFICGKRADAPVGWLLRMFQALEYLPTRRLTACFITVDAVRVSAS